MLVFTVPCNTKFPASVPIQLMSEIRYWSQFAFKHQQLLCLVLYMYFCVLQFWTKVIQILCQEKSNAITIFVISSKYNTYFYIPAHLCLNNSWTKMLYRYKQQSPIDDQMSYWTSVSFCIKMYFLVIWDAEVESLRIHTTCLVIIIQILLNLTLLVKVYFVYYALSLTFGEGIICSFTSHTKTFCPRISYDSS